MVDAVNDPVALRPESVEHYAKVLGKSKLSHAIFNAIYSYRDKPQTIEEIIERAQLNNTPKQSIRNTLNKFANKHLISRKEEKGRSLYGKYKPVMGMKDDILRHPASGGRKKAPATIRTPRVTTTKTVIKTRSAQKGASARKVKILYLTATPSSQEALRVDAEISMVQQQIRRSNLRDRIVLDHRPAADVAALMQGMNDLRPTIVHFSGHAGTSGLWMDDGRVVGSKGSSLPYKTLADLLDATDEPPRVVILNACKTDAASTSLVAVTDAVVTMTESISDLGAATFASQFHSAIASGQSVGKAFKQATAMMAHVSPTDAGIATVRYRAGVDGNKLKLT